MPEFSFSYELRELRDAVEETKNADHPFKEPFVQIIAKFGTSQEITGGEITGMSEVGVDDSDDLEVLVGTGNAFLSDLDEGQDALVVRGQYEASNNFGGARTLNVKVFGENGVVYNYGKKSSRDEQSPAPKPRKGKITLEG